MARNTNSAVFFNRIAWHQIYHFIIKVQCVKIGNILSEVIIQWRSQVIIQVTWEKEVVFIFDDIINTKYTKAKFQRDGIEPTRFNTKRENPTSKFCQHWSIAHTWVVAEESPSANSRWLTTKPQVFRADGLHFLGHTHRNDVRGFPVEIKHISHTQIVLAHSLKHNIMN